MTNFDLKIETVEQLKKLRHVRAMYRINGLSAFVSLLKTDLDPVLTHECVRNVTRSLRNQSKTSWETNIAGLDQDTLQSVKSRFIELIIVLCEHLHSGNEPVVNSVLEFFNTQFESGDLGIFHQLSIFSTLIQIAVADETVTTTTPSKYSKEICNSARLVFSILGLNVAKYEEWFEDLLEPLLNLLFLEVSRRYVSLFKEYEEKSAYVLDQILSLLIEYAKIPGVAKFMTSPERYQLLFQLIKINNFSVASLKLLRYLLLSESDPNSVKYRNIPMSKYLIDFIGNNYICPNDESVSKNELIMIAKEANHIALANETIMLVRKLILSSNSWKSIFTELFKGKKH